MGDAPDAAGRALVPTHRDPNVAASRAPQLLGGAQQAPLFGALLGTPADHRGRQLATVTAARRNGSSARDYPEYKFQDAAAASGKAVLYLAYGDIHKNAWVGASVPAPSCRLCRRARAGATWRSLVRVPLGIVDSARTGPFAAQAG